MAFQERYLEQLRASPGTEVTSIASRKRGRSLALWDVDEDVQKFITALRKSGTPVNTPVILAAAEGIIKSRDRTLLVEHGGHIRLTKNWAVSLMQRMNFVKRRGSTKAKIKLSDKEFTCKYLSQIVKLAHEKKVPPQLGRHQLGSNRSQHSPSIIVDYGGRRQQDHSNSCPW